jgi:hypothetical protein
MKKQYLGDSVYVEPDGFGGLKLTTDNGEGPTNAIIIDPYVLAAFLKYLDELKEEAEGSVDGRQ